MVLLVELMRALKHQVACRIEPAIRETDENTVLIVLYSDTGRMEDRKHRNAPNV